MCLFRFVYSASCRVTGPRSLPAWTLLLFLATVGARVQAHEVAGEMAEAAGRWLKALTPEQRSQAVFSLDNAERQNWHFVPRARKGLPFKEMTSAQQHLAHGLLSTGLSHRGYLKATTIMSLEAVLKELEQGKGPVRDPELYYLSVFGEPSAKGRWGWRVEGHHLSLNFTLTGGGQIADTPSFFGTNPAEVREGPRKGLRVLAKEEDLGYQLVRSLTEEQRATAVFSTKAPEDIITSPGRPAQNVAPEGLPGTGMTVEQVELLKALVREFAFRHRPELAEGDLRKVETAGWKSLHFGWAGGLETGEGHYYRVQGPTFILEFDNTQNHANHVHSVWRDFANDFGEDLLKQHYEQVPHH